MSPMWEPRVNMHEKAGRSSFTRLHRRLKMSRTVFGVHILEDSDHPRTCKTQILLSRLLRAREAYGPRLMNDPNLFYLFATVPQSVNELYYYTYLVPAKRWSRGRWKSQLSRSTVLPDSANMALRLTTVVVLSSAGPGKITSITWLVAEGQDRWA